MPKSKLIGRSRFKKQVHYNPYAGVVVGRQKEIIHGKRSKPIPGATHRITRLSPYMGSMITPENRNEFEKVQSESFIERYETDMDKERQKVLDQHNKTQEEIDKEVEKFDKERVSGMALVYMSKRFARYQSLKEQKHYKAWLMGKSAYQYKGTDFPVLTERFLNQAKSIKEIVNIGEDEQRNNTDGGEKS